MRSRWPAAAALVGLLSTIPATAGRADSRSEDTRPDREGNRTPSVGSSGLGDRFFPSAGNGGYDVANYDLKLAWDPATGVLTGDVSIEAKTLQNLDRFNLDLQGFTVSRLTVNERPAQFTREGQELIITPARRIEAREDLKINVRYSGVPQTIIDPDGALDGWIPTEGGAIALSEPQGSPSWFPANDYPTDKATMTMSMTVPNGLSVLGNGLPEDPKRRGPNTTFVWRERRPMATYLATIAIGKFDVTSGRTSAGIPIINAMDPKLATSSQPSVDRIGEILDWETTILGQYPFESVGSIAVDAPDVGYALETQTRPVFTSEVDDSTMVHELAHQWLGNSVSLSTWPDIWLNEGFATYFEWLWSEREGDATPAQIANAAYDRKAASNPFWTVAPGALPDPTELFTQPAYLRGAMTLQALRTQVGDDAFFRILRRWVTKNKDGNVSTADFIALSQSESGEDLTALFKTWLIDPVKPATSPAPAVAAAAASPTARSFAPEIKVPLNARAKEVRARG